MSQESRPAFELENVRVGHRGIGWRKAVSWWMTAIGAIGLLATYPESSFGLPAVLGGIGLTLLTWYYAATWSNLWSAPDAYLMGNVRVDDKTISIAGPKSFSIALDKLTTRAGWQDMRGFVTHFRSKNGDAITVIHDEPGPAQALLQAAGERVLLDKIRLSSWVQQGGGREIVVGLGLFGITTIVPVIAIGVVTAVMLAGPSAMAWAVTAIGIVAVMAALIYGTDKAIAEPLVTAGAEGLHLRGAVTRRFIRYKDLDAATLDRHGVRIRFRSGKDQLLPMWRHGTMDLPSTPEEDSAFRKSDPDNQLLQKRARLFERICAGIAAKGQSPMGDAQLALLDRKGRSLDEWRQAMEALLARAEGGYREVRIDPDALARVVENPAQPADRRVGAALALSRLGDGDVQQRLRFAVDTCADEKLRVSLDRATRGEVVEQELAELEAEAAVQSSRIAPRQAS